MNIDKNEIRNSVMKAKSQNIAYFLVNQTEKDAKKNVMAEVEKLTNKGTCEIIVIRKL